MCSPTTNGKTEVTSSHQTYRSKYTSTSKLTQSKLYKAISRTDLKIKN